MGVVISKLIFQPPKPSYTKSLPKLHFINNIIPILIFEPYLVRHSDSHPTILFSHGNAEDLGLIHSSLQNLSNTLSSRVVAFEYPGYGLYPSVPNEARVLQTAEQVMLYLTHEMKIPVNSIFVYGRSLGSGCAVYLAGKFPVAGCILQSPLLSVVRVLADLRYSVFFDQFVNIDRIKIVKCQVLVIHGDRDEVVPFEHGKTLYEAAALAASPLWLEGVGHNDIETEAGDKLERRLAEFLTSCT